MSSGRPPAAVAVIRSSGPHAFAAGEALCGTLPVARHAALRALRDPVTGAELDQALVLCFAGPASATGEDIVEYQCHGGRAVVDAILTVLAAQPGMRAAEPGEFTRRAFANGRIDLTEAEGLADLLEAETEAQRRTAMRNADGGLRRQVESWRARVVNLSARAEAAIDYVDDDETDGSDHALGTEAAALAKELAHWLARPRAEALKNGIRVVVAGPPNAGKSSLINALAGVDRAIVTDVAGTTRDVIEVPLNFGGIPFILADTAGLRASDDVVERIGIARAESEIAGADVLLWLGDPVDAPLHTHLLKVHARADQPDRQAVPAGSIATSTMTGSGIDAIIEHLVQYSASLVPGDEVALNRRQGAEIAVAERALHDTQVAQVEIVADSLRRAREAFDRVTGRAGIEDMLDALFGRFCLGK